MRIGSQTFSIIVSIHGFFLSDFGHKTEKLKFRIFVKATIILFQNKIIASIHGILSDFDH